MMFIRDQAVEWCHGDFNDAAHENRKAQLPWYRTRCLDICMDWFAMWRGV